MRVKYMRDHNRIMLTLNSRKEKAILDAQTFIAEIYASNEEEYRSYLRFVKFKKANKELTIRYEKLFRKQMIWTGLLSMPLGKVYNAGYRQGVKDGKKTDERK